MAPGTSQVPGSSNNASGSLWGLEPLPAKGHGMQPALPLGQRRGQWAKAICPARQHERLPTSGPLHMPSPLPGALHPFCLVNAYPAFSLSLNLLP